MSDHRIDTLPALMLESADRLEGHMVSAFRMGWRCSCGAQTSAPRPSDFKHISDCLITRLRSTADQMEKADADLAEADACIARYFPAAKIDTVQADTWRAIQRHKVRAATTDRGE